MSFTKADVQAIVAAEGVDNLTAKTVRLKLEAKLGLEDGALKSQKEEISKMIDEVLEENEDGGDDDEGGDEEEEDAEEEDGEDNGYGWLKSLNKPRKHSRHDLANPKP